MLAASLLAAAPGRAVTVKGNEPLVMRLVFDDCLGYIRHGRTPFKGLATAPASMRVIEAFPPLIGLTATFVQLLSPRYGAAWGQDEDFRYCYIQTIPDPPPPPGPGLLGVEPKGFTARMTKRAAAAGLTERPDAGDLSPIRVSVWSAPETGHEVGPLRTVRLAMIPMAQDKQRGLMDAGLIIVTGPPK